MSKTDEVIKAAIGELISSSVCGSNRMPSQVEMAIRNNVSPTLVGKVYSELSSRGIIVSEGSSGTLVSRFGKGAIVEMLRDYTAQISYQQSFLQDFVPALIDLSDQLIKEKAFADSLLKRLDGDANQ
jgi:DNA-binding transcriptional regulator YhcF (GntR family)